jgi:hypothetical protein
MEAPESPALTAYVSLSQIRQISQLVNLKRMHRIQLMHSPEIQLWKLRKTITLEKFVSGTRLEPDRHFPVATHRCYQHEETCSISNAILILTLVCNILCVVLSII